MHGVWTACARKRMWARKPARRSMTLLLPDHWELRSLAVVAAAVALLVGCGAGMLRWSARKHRRMVARLRCEHFEAAQAAEGRAARAKASHQGKEVSRSYKRRGSAPAPALQAHAATSTSMATATASATGSVPDHHANGNCLVSPPRYLPPPESMSKVLSIREMLEVRDGGFSWQQASALLDTGNSHCTIIDDGFAMRHALYSPSGDRQFGQAERWTTLHGVVPGVSSNAPVVTIQLRIRGHTFTIPCAISALGSQDVLVGVDVLSQLFAAGFRIESMS